MKKILLLGISLLTAVGADSQTFSKRSHPLAAEKYGVSVNENASNPGVQPSPNISSTPVAGKTAKAAGLSINWNAISKSINAFGVLSSDQKQLDYDENLDAVIFIQRKSPHYPMNPAPTTTGAISGGIVAMVTPDWGATWDSTLVWNNSTYWARYPQGGFYNPTGNTVLSGAYAVVTGPVTSAAQGWEGNFFGSKSLSVMDNVAGPGNQNRFYTNAGTTNADSVKKVDFANRDYCVGNDGVVRALGVIANDYNSATNNTMLGFRGARIVKGQFSSGVFLWTSDSISLVGQVAYDAPNLAYDVIDGVTNMAWSESGATGYLWFLGVRTQSTVSGNNRGFQPIVWKTSNNGASWALLPQINFNDTVKFKKVLKNLMPVDSAGDNSIIPFFNYAEDISGVVDKNDNLHLVSTLWSTQKSQYTLLGNFHTYTNTVLDNQVYRNPHTVDKKNWIYDFTTSQGGTSWDVTLVDTLETEFVGATGIGNGANPYTDAKQQIGARIQASRTPGGEYILYNWADSKYVFTDNALRWNTKPDLYVRARHADSTRVHPNEFDLTGFSQAGDVYSYAYMHHVSPKAKLSPNPSYYAFTLTLPVKVTASNPLVANTENKHYYASAVMTFTMLDVSVAENGMISAQSSVLFPNPAKDRASLSINLKNNSKVDVTVMNLVGQKVKTISTQAIAGDNNVDIELNGLSKGVYMVNIKVDNATATKKLIIE